MGGAVFTPGEQKIRPGIYVRVTNTGGPATAVVPQGTVAVLLRSSWGPLGSIVTLQDPTAVEPAFGSGGSVDAASEAFKGKCSTVKVYRLGSGGTAASLTLQDNATTPVDAVTLNLAYEGIDGNSYSATVRDSLMDANQRELIIYDGTTKMQTFTFAKGTTEPTDLVAAVNAMNLDWISATKVNDGSGTLAAVSQSKFAGGVDPTVTAADYSTGMAAIESTDWNVLAVDSEDPSVHATVQAFIDNQRNSGKLVRAVVGEPTSVDLATRQTDAKAFNDFAMHYVLNGFKESDTTIEGYRAAARVAGMIAAAAITDSLTHSVVSGATDLVGALSNSDIEASIQAGAIVFTFNTAKQVQIEYGINTYITPDANHDAGWKKIRRVSTRDYLMSEIVATWDPLVGKVNNNPVGRATLIAAAQGVVNQLIALGALLDGKVTEDKSNPPAGDSAWFVITVDDVDSAEKMYLNFGFEFAPAA